MELELRGLLLGNRLVDHAHDVAFLHDQVFDTIELDFGARPLAKEHAVTGLHIDRDQLAGFVAASRTDGYDLPLLGLFLRRVGNDDPASGLFFGFDALDNDAVMKRTSRRPLVVNGTGTIKPWEALAWGIALGAGATLLLGLMANWLSAALAFATLLTYLAIYTPM